jgi:hypothetical protein
MHRLKSNEENFQVVDGPFAGRQYQRGMTYQFEDIPPNEMRRFEKIEDKTTDGGEEA